MPNKSNPDRFVPEIVAAKLIFPPFSLHIPLVIFPISPADWIKQTGVAQALAILPIKPETQKPQTIPIIASQIANEPFHGQTTSKLGWNSRVCG
jgi:hypothetical protein